MKPWKYQPARDGHLSTMERARSVHREAGLLETTAHLGWLLFVRTYLRIFQRMRVRGRENIPREPPFVLLSNHTSHLDAVALSAIVPLRLAHRVFPVAAADVFFETPAGSLFSSVMINALPVWRKSCGPGALRELRDRLVGEPCAYILFPEGGRSRDGQMRSFRAGLGIIIAQTQVPLIPCYLDGAFRAMPPGSPWPRPAKLRVTVGSPMLFDHASNDREGWRTIAREAEDAVRRLGGLPAGSDAREAKGEAEPQQGEPQLTGP
jgi:1-acyl-sn-glycerol-3-phosphate acyltransferase